MHVKNHMAMWILWFLWFLCVRYSGNPLYKPLCAFLVFVVLVWFLCGRIRGFWSRVVFGSGLRVRSTSCGFCGSVVLPSMPMLMIARPLARRSCASDPPHVVFAARWSCLRCRCRRLTASMRIPPHVVFVGRWSCPRCRCLPVVLRVHLPAGIARLIHLMWFLRLGGLAFDADADD